MSQLNVENMKTRLLEEKTRLEHERSQFRPVESMSDEAGDAADLDVNHPADSGTETFERTKDMLFDANATAIIEQIDSALARIDDGTYGKCARCGQPIAPARLDAIPYAAYCITCQDIVENSL